MNALCLPRSQRVYRVVIEPKKKKKEKLLSSKKYYKQHSRWSFFPLSLIIYDPPPHTCAKRAHDFETRRAFPVSRKKILRTALETGILETPQSGTRYLTEETSNLKTDAPTIRHTAETVKGAAGFCQVAFEKFDVSRSALNIVTWPT